MAQPSQIRKQLAARLDLIAGLTGVPFPRGSVTPPCALVLAGPIDYKGTYQNGSIDLSYQILLLLGSADMAGGMEALDEYLASSGEKSILVTIEGDPTLGGFADYVTVNSADRHGEVEYNGVPYIGARFDVGVNADG